MTTTVDMERRARFEAIWAEHSLKVRAYCIRRVASHDADDVCAEIFLVVWRRIDEVPPAPKTLLYIYGIAGKVVSNHTRSFRRKSRLDEKLRNLGVAPAVDPAFLVVQSSDDAEVAAAVRNLSRTRPRDRDAVRLGGSAAQRHRRDHGHDQVRGRPENPPFLPATGSGSRAPHHTKHFPSDRRGRSDMTHEQIDRMVRKANPVRDPNALGPVDVSVLTTPLERRMEMQTDNREVTEGGGQNRSAWPHGRDRDSGGDPDRRAGLLADQGRRSGG